MSELIWLPESLADVDRLYAFLKSKNPAAAQRAANVILTGGDQIRHTPQIGRPMADGAGRRELFVPFGTANYVLRYMLEQPAKAVILRVWHSREDRTAEITEEEIPHD